jgi:hypothetical protein
VDFRVEYDGPIIIFQCEKSDPTFELKTLLYSITVCIQFEDNFGVSIGCNPKTSWKVSTVQMNQMSFCIREENSYR